MGFHLKSIIYFCLLVPAAYSNSTEGDQCDVAVNTQVTGISLDDTLRLRETHGLVPNPSRESLYDNVKTVSDVKKRLIEASRNQKKNPQDPIYLMILGDFRREYFVNLPARNKDKDFYRKRALDAYDNVLSMLYKLKSESKRKNIPTNIAKGMSEPMRSESHLEYENMSIDGLIHEAEHRKGRIHFQSDMFKEAVESLENSLAVFDSTHVRYLLGYISIILNDYVKAVEALVPTLNFEDDFFYEHNITHEEDAISCLVMILLSEESYVDGGWIWLKNHISQRLEAVTLVFNDGENNNSISEQSIEILARKLSMFHLGLFYYYDLKSNDIETASYHLGKYSTYAMHGIPAYNKTERENALEEMKQKFKYIGLLKGTGTEKKTPIFIIGFPRSGSSLLEKVLDSHSNVVGTGEKSLLGYEVPILMYDYGQAVQAYLKDRDFDSLKASSEESGNRIIKLMYDRYEQFKQLDETIQDSKEPKRIVDKYLSNYKNVGLIHYLFPNALILHVMRDPMDCLLSCHKHQFGGLQLEYTNDFDALAHMYNIYRDWIDYWEEVLPGRITHIRYEDLVRDTPNVVKALINEAGLPWEDGILNSNKEKYVINTVSSSQVNKNIYSHHLYASKKYEKHLQPLTDLLGDRIELNYPTTLPGYKQIEANQV